MNVLKQLLFASAVTIVSSSIVSCAGRADDKAMLAKPVDQGPVPVGSAISGYNSPIDWQNDIGVRAVARGHLLMISIENKRTEPIFVEPAAIRIILPDKKLYELKPDRELLSGFQPRYIAPGEGQLFSAGIPQSVGDLTSYSIIFNHPPTKTLLTTAIEPAVVQTVIPD